MAAVASNTAASISLDANPATEGGAHGEVNGDEVDGGEAVTVFHNPNDFNVIHPLASAWTLWFTKPPTGKGDHWNDLLKEVITFESVEMFWSIWHNVTKVSDLPVKADYHLFKQGVRPEWEDPQNKHGGKWAYTSKERRTTALNDQWLQVMLAAIGEVLEDEDDNEVMGVVVNIRKGFYRIGLWTRTAGKAIPAGPNGPGRTAEESGQVLRRLGQRFKSAMKLDSNEPVEFTGHSDSAQSGSTRAKAKITV